MATDDKRYDPESELEQQDPQGARAQEGIATGLNFLKNQLSANLEKGHRLIQADVEVAKKQLQDPNYQLTPEEQQARHELYNQYVGAMMGSVKIPESSAENVIRVARQYKDLIGKGTEYVVDEEGQPIAKFIEGNMPTEAPRGNLEPTLTPSEAASSEKTIPNLEDQEKTLVNPEDAEKTVVGMADGGDVQAQPQGDAVDQFLATQQQPMVDSSQPTVNQAGGDAVDQFLSQQQEQQEYSSPGQAAAAAAEGLARGVAGPLAPLAERILGVQAKGIRAREEYNPKLAKTAEAGGFLGSLLTGTGEAALVGKAGEAAAKAAKLGEEGAGYLSRIGASGLKGAVETGLIAAGDETSKLITEDPNQSAQTAMANVGLATVLGGGVGSAFGAVSPLWKMSIGTKLAQTLEDFKGRINEHLANPEPVEAMHKELSDLYNGVNSVAEDVYGPTGLKAQDIAAAVPQNVSEGMLKQSSDIVGSVEKTLSDMKADPYRYPPRLTSKIQDDLSDYLGKVTNPDSSSVDMFNAGQDLKQTLQGYAKFERRIPPFSEEYDFIQKAKNLSFDLRNALEDKQVWGKAAERQQTINKAFSDYLPKLKDFESKFTTEIAGDKVIDPGKVQTYLNQIGKPSSEIKQQMLKNFLDASERYMKVIHDSHVNLGLEPPVAPTSLNFTKSTMNEMTAGRKLADALIKKGLGDAGGKALGAGVGGSIGHIFGSGGIGALIGEHALGPFFNSVLPAIAKPIMKAVSNQEGAKAAVDFGMAVAKGEKALKKATENVFRAGEVVPDNLMPTSKDHEKIVKVLDKARVEPDTMLKVAGQVPHYLPDHGTAVASSSQNIVNYLNSVKPETEPKSPLDPKPVLSKDQKAAWNNALDIAQQPMVVLNKVKDGSITSKDLVHLNAMYPDLYKRMQAKLYDQVINIASREERIPYALKQGLSMFLGQPLDSSLTPQAIAAAQPLPANQPGPQQVPSQPKRSMTALNKLPKQYQTASEDREARRSKA